MRSVGVAALFVAGCGDSLPPVGPVDGPIVDAAPYRCPDPAPCSEAATVTVKAQTVFAQVHTFDAQGTRCNSYDAPANEMVVVAAPRCGSLHFVQGLGTENGNLIARITDIEPDDVIDPSSITLPFQIRDLLVRFDPEPDAERYIVRVHCGDQAVDIDTAQTEVTAQLACSAPAIALVESLPTSRFAVTPFVGLDEQPELVAGEWTVPTDVSVDGSMVATATAIGVESGPSPGIVLFRVEAPLFEGTSLSERVPAFWPATALVRRTDADHDVEVHVQGNDVVFAPDTLPGGLTSMTGDVPESEIAMKAPRFRWDPSELTDFDLVVLRGSYRGAHAGAAGVMVVADPRTGEVSIPTFAFEPCTGFFLRDRYELEAIDLEGVNGYAAARANIGNRIRARASQKLAFDCTD